MAEFRPISVINLIHKLISKVLSNRLRPFLPSLISPNQTAFIQGRQISDNFVATRELLHHVSNSNRRAIFAKVDFRKAFDTVQWNFLHRVMAARGFPNRWLKWMDTIWSTSSSRVCVNRDSSQPFFHKRGLRQGDPLSPMLFNLAVDVLQRMIHAANTTLNQPLTQRVSYPIVAFQYIDDKVAIASVDILTIISLKLALRLFTSISGL